MWKSCSLSVTVKIFYVVYTLIVEKIRYILIVSSELFIQNTYSFNNGYFLFLRFSQILMFLLAEAQIDVLKELNIFLE